MPHLDYWGGGCALAPPASGVHVFQYYLEYVKIYNMNIIP